jgi:CheY-like chemotaxis protein
MHGFKPGQTIDTVEEAVINIHPEDQPVITARFMDAVQNRAELECEYRVIMFDGSEQWVAASGQIIQTDLDEPQSFKMFGIVQDVTERKQAEAERERLLNNEQAARQTAEEASRMKDEFLAASPPDALVADIGMPDEDGYSLMRKIRRLPSSRGGMAPALALTAYARPEDRARALTAGFQQFVSKPVKPDELAAVVAELTRRPDAPSRV